MLRRLTTKVTSTYQDMRYGYDPGWNVTAIVDPTFGTQSFRYDELDRLISATGPYGTGGATATRPFGYDQIGNLTLHCTLGDLAYPPSGLGNVGPHRVCGVGTTSCPGTPHYQYDLNGNVTSATPPGGPAYSIPTYDIENRPTSIAKGGVTTTMSYREVLGRVTKTVSGTITTYVGRWYECTGGTCTKYIFAGDQRIAMKQGSTVTYVHPDHLSSSSVLTKGVDGTKDEQLTYFPFGQTRTDTDGGGTPVSPGFRYKYTDQEFDDTTGLYYYKARYYDPALGRFIQPDPIVPDLYGPQSLNPYSYVLNNPLRYTDPSGLQAEITLSVTVTVLPPPPVLPYGYGGLGSFINPATYNFAPGAAGPSPTFVQSFRGTINVAQQLIAPPRAIQPLPPGGAEEVRREILKSPTIIIATGLAGGGGKAGGPLLTKLGRLYRSLRIELDVFRGAVSPEAASIARGHALVKHASDFPEIANEHEFARLIENIMRNPSSTATLARGRTAYYDAGTNTLVIKDLLSPDMGTAFRPERGLQYFLGLE